MEPPNLVALVAKLAGRNTKESFDF
jgi:hypothetical protein